MDNGKRVLTFLGGLCLMALGIVVVMMNTTVRFQLYAYNLGGTTLSSGLLLIPFLISIVLLVALKSKWPGIVLFWLSMAFILISLILSLRFNLNSTNMFNLVLMFAPIVIGLGLVIKSFFNFSKRDSDNTTNE